MVNMICRHRETQTKGFPKWFQIRQFASSILIFVNRLLFENILFLIEINSTDSFFHLIQLRTSCLKWPPCPYVYKVEDNFSEVLKIRTGRKAHKITVGPLLSDLHNSFCAINSPVHKKGSIASGQSWLKCQKVGGRTYQVSEVVHTRLPKD